jgi:kynurenine formamidase
MSDATAPCPPYRVQTEIEMLGRRCLVTDLSHDISTDDPVFPGHQRTIMWQHLSHEETQKLGLTKPPYSYQVMGFTMCDHSNTHVDAINHVVDAPDARSVDQLPLEWFMTPAIWLDFSHLEPNAYITRQEIDRELERTGVRPRPNSVVLYHTGWYQKFRGDKFGYLKNYPGLDREGMEYLNDLGAISVGADAPSVDSWHEVAEVRVQPAHIVCRERRILNMENLANIDLIPSHEFWFIGLPLRLRGGSGGPFHGVALVDVEADRERAAAGAAPSSREG